MARGLWSTSKGLVQPPAAAMRGTMRGTGRGRWAQYKTVNVQNERDMNVGTPSWVRGS